MHAYAVFVVVAGGLLLGGCGGDDADGAPIDGTASDGSTTVGTDDQADDQADDSSDDSSDDQGDGQGDDQGDADGSSGGPSGPLAELCDGAAALLAQCSAELTECDAATLADCAGVFGLLRDEFVVARNTCGWPEACGPIETFDERLCEWEQTTDVLPTEAQTTLAEAVCTACFDDSDACLADAFFRPMPIQGGATAAGVGSLFLEYDDAIAEAALSCVPQPQQSSCVQPFIDCFEDLIGATQPAPVTEACDDSGTPFPD